MVEFSSLAQLRDYVEHCIASNNKDIDYEVLIQKISDFSSDFREEKLEIAIVLSFFLEKEGKRTSMKIDQLRRSYENSGNTIAFEPFIARCMVLIYPKILASHGFALPVTKEDHGDVTAGIVSIINKINEIGHEAFVNSGALLGIIRDKTYIPYDDDVDIGVILRANSAQSAASEWSRFKHHLEVKGLFQKVAWPGATYKIRNAGRLTVDLFPSWIENGLVYVFPHTFGELLREDLLPLAKSEPFGLPIPHRAESMLAINYGSGWTKPDPYYKFPWDSRLKKYRIFLDELKKLQSREESK